VRADHNTATGNTAGIVSFTLPFLAIKTNSDNQIDHNTVTGNNSFGIGVGNFCVVTHLPPVFCAGLDIDPNSDSNQILNNLATGNGLAPDPAIAPLPGSDLLWDGTGTGNCWQNNTADSTFPAPLPTCP
jgi:hypothetical protein